MHYNILLKRKKNSVHLLFKYNHYFLFTTYFTLLTRVSANKISAKKRIKERKIRESEST